MSLTKDHLTVIRKNTHWLHADAMKIASFSTASEMPLALTLILNLIIFCVSFTHRKYKDLEGWLQMLLKAYQTELNLEFFMKKG